MFGLCLLCCSPCTDEACSTAEHLLFILRKRSLISTGPKLEPGLHGWQLGSWQHGTLSVDWKLSTNLRGHQRQPSTIKNKIDRPQPSSTNHLPSTIMKSHQPATINQNDQNQQSTIYKLSIHPPSSPENLEQSIATNHKWSTINQVQSNDPEQLTSQRMNNQL